MDSAQVGDGGWQIMGTDHLGVSSSSSDEDARENSADMAEWPGDPGFDPSAWLPWLRSVLPDRSPMTTMTTEEFVRMYNQMPQRFILGQRDDRDSLDTIALRYGTDKSSASHNYAPIYERYLEPLRDEPITLLELGWGGHDDPREGGASAYMWEDYFPNAQIVVVDVEPKTVTFADDTRIELLQMSQDDVGITEYGPFDVIIDDASHLSSLTIRSFEMLYHYLKPGGLYVIEDSHMAYHTYYGWNEANPDPDAPVLERGRVSPVMWNDPSLPYPTAMQFFRRMADEVNIDPGQGEWCLYPPDFWLGYELSEVSFFYNLCLMRKRS